MANLDLPANNPLANEDGTATMPWMAWFQRVHNVMIAAYQSGTTAQRPKTGLYYGRQYYDLTLNKPVYFNALPSTWRDAAGVIV